MNQTTPSQIASFIWNIADVLRGGGIPSDHWRDIILPMCVLRRLDAVLEPTKESVLAKHKELRKAGRQHIDPLLRQASKQAFYNTSKFTLKKLMASGGRQPLFKNFEEYLKGFSPNVREIMDNFHFHYNLTILSKKDLLGMIIERFTATHINLSPSGLDNHGMGMIFEELVRRFNENNNKKTGKHWTPRDAVQLMAQLVFRPIEDQLSAGTYTIYDCACGTGGMLTIAEEELLRIAKRRNINIKCWLYGQENSAETLAVCKADMLLKGEGKHADNMHGESTLSADAFNDKKFDFMLTNPPYGINCEKDLDVLGGKKTSDPRFLWEHKNETLPLITRLNDGQMMFLANIISKMQSKTKMGSRIAEVHNGSPLFVGDAGQGESNIRRMIIETDLLEAIIALPENMFYNTDIATYIWVLSNRKTKVRQGKVQLINASKWFSPLRKNLGKKNCKLSENDIQKIIRTFLNFKKTQESKILPNNAFGYQKITVERPLRLRAQFSPEAIDELRFSSGDSHLRKELYDSVGGKIFTNFAQIADKAAAQIDQLTEENYGHINDNCKRRLLDPQTWARDSELSNIAKQLRDKLGDNIFNNYNNFSLQVAIALKKLAIRTSATEKKRILKACSWRDSNAPPVERTVHSHKKPNPLYGLFAEKKFGKTIVMEYESDSELRDIEQVPLTEKGGIKAFFKREVLLHAPDAWIKQDTPQIGYEINFNRHFHKPQKTRTPDEIHADITAVQKKSNSLMRERAVIHRTITRGLNSSVAIKPSGIDFIGDIPTHWRIAPIKYCMTKFYSGGTPDSTNDDYYCAFDKGVPWLMISDMTGQRYIDRTQTAITRKGIMSENLDILPAGTILMSMYASIGTIAILRINAAVNQAIIGMCPNSKILNAEYCLYYMESLQPYIIRFTDSSTQANLNAQKVRNLPIVIPPLSEQTAIIKHLNKTTTTINTSAEYVHRETTLLREYRDSLVANAVTGKTNVRSFTASSTKNKKRI